MRVMCAANSVELLIRRDGKKEDAWLLINKQVVLFVKDVAISVGIRQLSCGSGDGYAARAGELSGAK
jgi:hypothetical protein